MDTRTGDCVAIKQLSLGGISQDNLAGIMGEIDLLKNLNHPNIVKYVGSFKTRTHLYIILEFMENGALSSVIKPSKFGAFPESLAAVYIAQVSPQACDCLWCLACLALLTKIFTNMQPAASLHTSGTAC